MAISPKAVEKFDEARELINILVSNGQVQQQKLNNALLLHDAGCFGDMFHPIPWQIDHPNCWQTKVAYAFAANTNIIFTTLC